MQQQTDGPSLIDGMTVDPVGPRVAGFLDKAMRAIDEEALAGLIRADMVPDQPQGGRPIWQMDVTSVQQATDGKDQAGKSTRDRCANHTKKHGRTYHRYKAHVNVSKDRVVTVYVFDKAESLDSRYIDQLDDEQKRRNRACSKMRAFVEHPFAWMGALGYVKARYRGLQCNGLGFGLTVRAYNIKRGLSLLGMALSPPRSPKPATRA